MIEKPGRHEVGQSLASRVELLLSVCTGALVRGEAGFLAGLKATSHHRTAVSTNWPNERPMLASTTTSSTWTTGGSFSRPGYRRVSTWRCTWCTDSSVEKLLWQWPAKWNTIGRG
jgi:hypothetical protein